MQDKSSSRLQTRYRQGFKKELLSRELGPKNPFLQNLFETRPSNLIERNLMIENV